jgi:nucleotide-binding universal stress UspA family protein
MVTLDGSKLSEYAITPAATIAHAMDAQLVLLRVVVPLQVWAPFVDIEPQYSITEERLEAETSAYLRETEASLRQRYPGLRTTTAVASGPVAESIIDWAKIHDVDLIVMSSHGRSGFSRWVYGSVAEKVLRGATFCSTLVVRETIHDARKAYAQPDTGFDADIVSK